MINNEWAIQATGLTRQFDQKLAVDNINLTIPPGEIYGFLGPNGAGKSTTIRMLVTLLVPTSGDAWIAGHSIRNDVTRVRLSIGVALQEAALDVQQTGLEFLRLQGRLYGLTAKDVQQRVKELRDLIDLGEAFEQRIKTYSGGMKRRLDLAAALIHHPRVLFLDEPTTGLDPVSRMRVWDEIRKLNKELGITIFMSTQYMEEADQLTDRLGIIADGRIVAEGTARELKQKIGADLVIIQVQQGAEAVAPALQGVHGIGQIEVHGQEITIACQEGSRVIGPVAMALHQAGIVADQLTLRTPSLDDVFLEVTGNRMRKNTENNSSTYELHKHTTH